MCREIVFPKAQSSSHAFGQSTMILPFGKLLTNIDRNDSSKCLTAENWKFTNQTVSYHSHLVRIPFNGTTRKAMSIEEIHSWNSTNWMFSMPLGKRACPGEVIAKMEVFVYFVSILQRFDVFPLPGKKISFDEEVGVSLRPVSQEILFKKRSPHE